MAWHWESGGVSMTYDIANVTTEVYGLLSQIIAGLGSNATALVGLLVLGIIVYLAKDLIGAVFGIFGGLKKIGKR
jgi:hypothetical protein